MSKVTRERERERLRSVKGKEKQAGMKAPLTFSIADALLASLVIARGFAQPSW